jgi:hypothetical protein
VDASDPPPNKIQLVVSTGTYKEIAERLAKMGCANVIDVDTGKIDLSVFVLAPSGALPAHYPWAVAEEASAGAKYVNACQYVQEALLGFINDQPDSAHQEGYLEALKTVWEEALGGGEPLSFSFEGTGTISVPKCGLPWYKPPGPEKTSHAAKFYESAAGGAEEKWVALYPHHFSMLVNGGIDAATKAVFEVQLPLQDVAAVHEIMATGSYYLKLVQGQGQ